jgi:hypothetical protein
MPEGNEVLKTGKFNREERRERRERNLPAGRFFKWGGAAAPPYRTKMNTTKVEIKIAKLKLEPGEVLVVSLPEVTRKFSAELGESIRKFVGPERRVVFLHEGITLERLTVEKALELVRACPETVRRALELHESLLVTEQVKGKIGKRESGNQGNLTAKNAKNAKKRPDF